MNRFEEKQEAVSRKFKAAFDGIKAPEDLKADTLCKMFGGKEQTLQIKQNNRKRRWIGTCAAVLCIMFVCVIWGGRTDNGIVTSLEENVFYDTVELKNGELRFINKRVNIDVTPNAGQAAAGSTEDEMQGENSEKELDREEAKEGGSLFMRKAAKKDLEQVSEEEWSYVGKKKLYITVVDGGKGYCAVFEKDGDIYALEGISVSQKNFIEYLLKKIK